MPSLLKTRNYSQCMTYKIIFNLHVPKITQQTRGRAGIQIQTLIPESSLSNTVLPLSGCCSVAKPCLMLSHVPLFDTPWTAARQAFLSSTISQSLLKLISIESVMPSNHLILCCPLLLPPSIIPSIRVLSNESVLCIRWPKDWSFSFSISPSNEHSGLMSFRIDWLDLLAVQGTLKSLLQNHSPKSVNSSCHMVTLKSNHLLWQRH